MREMEYMPNRLETPLVLDKGVIHKIPYLILSMGTHPCCYIGINNYAQFERLDNEITFEDKKCPLWDDVGIVLWLAKEDTIEVTKWIGWDHAHLGDFSGFTMRWNGNEINQSKLKKWTTKEMQEEVAYAIQKIVEGDVA